MDTSFFERFFHYHEWKELGQDCRYCQQCNARQHKHTFETGRDYDGEPYYYEEWVNG